MESSEYEKIGCGILPGGEYPSKTLSVTIPPSKKIVNIKAYFANMPFGPGESDFQPTTFAETSIQGYKGVPYKEWSYGWAYAKLHSIGSIENGNQKISVTFFSWLGDNSRKAKLEVYYEI